MIRAVYTAAFLCCQLFAINKIEYAVSFEYWLNEDFKIFSVNNVVMLEIEDDTISLSSNSWFGETILDEDIEYENQSFLEKNIFNIVFLEKVVSEEDSWIEGYHLLNGKKIKVRYLFSAEEGGLRLYRMDIKELNKDRDNNKINNVILDNDIITIWTDLNKEIKKIALMYKNATYVIKFDEN